MDGPLVKVIFSYRFLQGIFEEHSLFTFIFEYFRCFVLIVVYIISGVVFMKYKKEATGSELIPNKQLWISLPALVKVNILVLYSFT